MKETKLSQKVEKEIEKVSEAAGYLWQKNWAERNGGNISLNLTDKMELESNLGEFRYNRMELLPKESANKIFFVTGKGERLRELREPDKAACIIQIDKNADGYYIIWGGKSRNDFEVTSEFVTHLGILLDMEKRKPEFKAVLHTHPIELISLSHHPEVGKDKTKFNRVLWAMLPEVRGFVPRGIDLIPYTLTGSKELAELTIKSLREKDVSFWSKHGAIAAGKNALEAFDFIDVANKGAEIYLKCLASGFEPMGLSDEEIKELEREFNL